MLPKGRIRGAGALLDVALLSGDALETLSFNTLFHLWRLQL